MSQLPANQLAIKDFLTSETAKNKLADILGKNSTSFITSVLQVVNDNTALQNADPKSIFNAICVSATLNLPINNNLGFAYIVPYSRNVIVGQDNKGKNIWEKRTEAQFQLGYKGFIQLAQRSGQFKRINACAIYSDDSEQDVYQRLTSLLPKPPKGKPTGYIAYFELLNGYVAHLSMSIDELKAHAGKYSQSFKNGGGVWKDHFEAMATKTVIKLLLSRQAPLSVDMQTAIQADQAVIDDDGGFIHADYQVVNAIQPIPVTDEQMPQVLALTQTLPQSEIFGRYDLTFEQAQMVQNAYQQQGVNNAYSMQ